MRIKTLLVPSLVVLLLLLTNLPASQGWEKVQFTKTLDGLMDEYGFGIAVDLSGIYISGYTDSFGPGSPNHFALLLLKYNTTGSLLFQKIWSGTGDGNDIGRRVEVDSFGNVYVAGYTNSSGAGSYDALLLKFDPLGNLIWQRTWGGAEFDFADGVAVDSGGNVYVAGTTESFGASSGEFLLKYNSTGTLLWQETWNGLTVSAFGAVAVDGAGNVYVTGQSYVAGHGSDVFILKYNANGRLLWQKTWGGSNDDYASDASIDSAGNIYITGWEYSFGAGSADVFLLKLEPSGVLQWQRTWGGKGIDIGYGVSADAFGHVYVTGNTFNFGAGFVDVILLKFSSWGSLIDQEIWGNTVIADEGYSVTTDNYGNAYVTGYLGGPVNTYRSNGNSTLGSPTYQISDATGAITNQTTPSLVPSGTVATISGSQVGVTSTAVMLSKYESAPTVTLHTDPIASSITLNGTTYPNGQRVNLTQGSYPVSVNPPAGYPFTQWTATGGISVLDPKQTSTIIQVTGDGTLTAGFQAPTITFWTNPNTGGSISFNGSSFTVGQQANFLYGNATAEALPISGYKFSSWNTTGGITVANAKTPKTTVKILGSGTLEANFEPIAKTPLTIPPNSILLFTATIYTAIQLRRSRTRLKGPREHSGSNRGSS